MYKMTYFLFFSDIIMQSEDPILHDSSTAYINLKVGAY
jgi:hypothetical protein